MSELQQPDQPSEAVGGLRKRMEEALIGRREFLRWGATFGVALGGIIYLPNAPHGDMGDAPPGFTPTVPPTETPTPTERAPLKEIVINPQTPLYTGYAALPRWVRAGRLVGQDTPVTAEYKGSVVTTDGAQEQHTLVHLMEVSGVTYVVDPQDLDTPIDEEDIVGAEEDTVPWERYEVVENSITLNLYEAIPANNAVEIPVGRRDQLVEYDVKFSVVPTGEELDPNYGDSIYFGNFPNTVILDLKKGKLSNVVSDSSSGYVKRYRLKNDQFGNRVELLARFKETRDAVTLIDPATGQTLPVLVNGQEVEEIPLGPATFDKSSVWSAGAYTGDSIITVEELTQRVRTVQSENSAPVIQKPEYEIGNGLAEFSEGEVLPYGYGINSSTPHFLHLLKENTSGGVDFSQGTFLMINAMGSEGEPVAFTNHDVLLRWFDEHNVPYFLNVDLLRVSQRRVNRKDLSDYIALMTQTSKGRPVTVNNLFARDGSGNIDSKIPFLPLYSNNKKALFTDVVRQINEDGSPANIVVPKCSAAGVQNAFGEIRAVNVEHDIESVQIDVGGLTPTQAIDAILQFKADPLEFNVYMDRIADNTGGLTVEEQVDISVLTGIERRIPDFVQDDAWIEKDPTKQQMFERDVEGRVTYTPVYYRYRDKLEEIARVSGRIRAVQELMYNDPYYFQSLREVARDNPEDTRWQILERANPDLNLDSILNRALEKVQYQ